MRPSGPAEGPVDYFTQERLDRYRRLHRDYPLWSGHWPNDLAAAPERTMWTFRRRVRVEGRDLRPRALGVQQFRAERRLAFVALRDGLVERRTPPDVCGVFLDFDALGRSGRFEIPVTLPAPEYQLVQAIAYTLAQWPLHPDGDSAAQAALAEVDPIEVWAARLNDEMRHCFPIFGEPFERQEPHRWSFGTANEFLRATERGDPERQSWVTRLRRQWLKLGEEIGIIPRLAGGAKCSLPAAFLRKLDAELTGLSAEIRRYVPNQDEIEAVLRMLTGEAAFRKAFHEAETLAEAKRRRALADAPSEPLHWAARLRSQYKADLWALRLAFPMLTAPEIELLRRRQRQVAAGRRTIPTKRVLADRLGVSPGTLQNLLTNP